LQGYAGIRVACRREHLLDERKALAALRRRYLNRDGIETAVVKIAQTGEERIPAVSSTPLILSYQREISDH